MEIKTGTWRVVIVLPVLGIVIKFPRVFLWEALQDSYVSLREGGWPWLRTILEISLDNAIVCGPQGQLFKGIADNLREFLFCFTTRHPFVEPTLFSLFGLLNVQRLSPDLQIDRNEFWEGICRAVGGGDFHSGYEVLMDDPHHFSTLENFSYRDGYLFVRDYGSPRSRKIIAQHGEKIRSAFKVE